MQIHFPESAADVSPEQKERQSGCNVIYSRRQSQFSVDCAQAHKGLFSGILVLAVTIISLIMFFELVAYEEYKDAALLQVSIAPFQEGLEGDRLNPESSIVIRKRCMFREQRLSSYRYTYIHIFMKL